MSGPGGPGQGHASLDDRIPELLRRVDLAAEVERRAGPPTSQSGGTLTFRCPHPDHPDRTPSFTVTGGRWRCWSQCDRGGDVIDLVVWLDGGTKAGAIEALATEVGMARPPVPVRPANKRNTALEAALDKFLGSRSWEREVTERLGVHPVLEGGQLRVRFPFYWGGQAVYHQDRLLGSGPKWLSARGAIPCPYNADAMVLARQRRGVYVVEGVSDVVALMHAFEDPAVIGCPGSGTFKREWANRTLFGRLAVYVVADNDPAGEQFRARLEAMLRPVARAVVQVQVPADFKDVDEWRQARLDTFAEEFLAAGDRAEAAVTTRTAA